MITILPAPGSPFDKPPNKTAWNRMRSAVRDAILHHLRDYTRERVRDRSQGAGGSSLLGYSTNPLFISYPSLRKRITKPRGVKKVRGGYFFQGGYKEYKEKAGLVHERFNFFNTGDAWRDWKILRYGTATTASHIGFTKPENAIAANAAISKRPLLFRVDKSELSVIDAKVLGLINDLIIPP